MATRMSDFSDQDKYRNALAKRKKMGELSAEAAAEAAGIDVTSELVPEHIRAKTRIKLLGLIAALGNDAVFQKVQEALGTDTEHPPMSVSEFNKKMGVSGFSDLVKKLAHKYTTPNSALHAWLALYTLGPLRDDPTFFQIAWGLGLMSRVVASRTQSPFAQTLANEALFTALYVEVGFRGGRAAFHLANLLRCGTKPNMWELLLSVHGFLTCFVFFADVPTDLVAKLSK